MSARECSKTNCSRPAVATLTFNYADSTAVIGPLPPERTPHSYDLCVEHARSFTVPNGWSVTRLPGRIRESDDVLALARALAETPDRPRSSAGAASAGANSPTAQSRTHPAAHSEAVGHAAQAGRHLRVVRSPDDA